MSIKVERPSSGFTTIPDVIIRCEDVSVVARMLWIYLASLPSDWRPRAAHLQTALGVGRDRLQSACKELEVGGMLARKPDRDGATGRVRGQVWELLTPAYLKIRQADRVPDAPAGGETRQAADQAPYIDRDHQDREEKKTEGGASAALPAPTDAPAAPADLDLDKKKRAKPRARQMGDWFPSDELMDWAANQMGVTLVEARKELDKFRDHHIAKASAFVDWDAAWRNWARREGEFRARDAQRRRA